MLTNKFSTVQTMLVIVWTVFLNASTLRMAGDERLNDKKIRVLRLEMSVPILSPADTIHNEVTYLNRYEFNDFYIHAIPVTHSHSDIIVNPEKGEIIKDTLTGVWETYQYFVFKKEASKGLFYDSIDALAGKTVSVDSILARKTITIASKFIDQVIRNDSLVKTWKNDDGVVESYIAKVKKDLSYSDTLKLYFSNKMGDFHFSLSDSLEKVKGMKLCQMKLIYNENPSVKDIYASKARQIVMKIEEIPVTNSSEILQLIDKFRKESADKKIQ